MNVPSANTAWDEVDKILAAININDPPKFESPAADSSEFRGTIDHTVLKLDATAEDIDKVCQEAWEYDFASVCVRPEWVQRCVENLARYPKHNVLVASVIGFHEGDYPLEHKLKETALSLSAGAHELDIVLNPRDLHAHAYATLHAELTALRAAAPRPHTTLKLIIETSRCRDERDIVAACALAGLADFDFVKTSTGFHGAGATAEHVRLMRACAAVVAARRGAGEEMRVKASGGIRDLEQAGKMLQTGASRLGCSASVAIAKQGGAVPKTVPVELQRALSTTMEAEKGGASSRDESGY